MVKRQSDSSTILTDSRRDGLTNPPYGIRYELEAPCVVKTLCRLDKTNVSLRDEVREVHVVLMILIGYRDNEAKVCFYKSLTSLVRILAALSNPLCECHLFIFCCHRITVYFLEIIVN